MAPDHGITIDEQVRWLGEQGARRLKMAANRDKRVAEDREYARTRPGSSWYLLANAKRKEADGVKLREEAAVFLAIENTLRAVQVSAVSPPSASPADSPLGPNGSGGFYRGD
jgi:hypothetical protein